MDTERHQSIELMARLCTFCEVVLGAGTETTAITRSGDAPFGCFETEIFARFNHFTLRSAGKCVQLFVQSLDDHGEEQTLLTEVLSSDEHALATLRTIVSALEALAEMKARKNSAGLLTIQKIVDEALVSSHVQLRRWRRL